MLKKISTGQLVIGMYVDRLCGSWLHHPFWKRTSLVTETGQLQRLVGSAVREVWIDTSRGLDVPADAQPPAITADREIEAMLETVLDRSWADLAPQEPCSLADELDRAGRIVAQTRGAMKLMFQDVRLGKAIDAETCLPLVHEITQSIDRNRGALVSLARLKTSDDYTYMHSVAVCALMISLARQLELSEDETREAGIAGLVHDLGKARMPPHILGKAGALTDDEFAVMRTHPRAGYDMLLASRGVSPAAMDVCLHHHERIDGRGYPSGLAGERIPPLARMGAVCDVYDAITSNRPYKMGWDPSLSIQKMAQWSREGQFDEAMMQAFIKSIGIYPVGSLVRLASQRLAVVIDQTPTSLLTPVVKAVFSIVNRTPCRPEWIDLSAPGCRERIVARENAETWGLASIDGHWLIPVAVPHH